MTSISVLISVYSKDTPQYLEEALQSIWSQQTLRPTQIVLIQDGPLPAPLQDVIAHWKSQLGQVLTLVSNPVNMGLTHSLNKAIKAATGNYIARMDSDDRSTPQRFEQQAAYLDNHPDIDIVGGCIQEFNAENPCLNIRQYPLTHQAVISMIHKASPLAHPTVMMRRRIFDNGLHYDERYRTSQDIVLWFDAIHQGYHIGNLPVIILHFRRADNVYQRRSKAKAWNEFLIYIKGINKLSGPFSLKYIYPLGRLCFRLMPISLIRRIYDSPIRRRITEH